MNSKNLRMNLLNENKENFISTDNKRFIKHIGELDRKHKIALLENLEILILG